MAAQLMIIFQLKLHHKAQHKSQYFEISSSTFHNGCDRATQLNVTILTKHLNVDITIIL